MLLDTIKGSQLWAGGVKDPNYKYVRAHWSAGIGVWQLDSQGLGSDLSFHQAVFTDTSSRIVASEMAKLYKNASGTAANKRKAAWGPWYGCGSNKQKCETIYNEIYNSSRDTLNVDRDSSVKRTGGLVTRSCYDVNNPRVKWNCYKFDVSNAQGHTGSWYYRPYNGSSTLQPVPLPFYTYWLSDSSGKKMTEYRHWLKADTGYDTSKWGTRAFGTDARSSVKWFSGADLGVSL